MNPVKMIVTDLDGTLLRTDKTISDYSLSVFTGCRNAGIITAVATGRLGIEVKRFVDILQPDIVITDDGAFARYHEEIIYRSELEADTTDRLLKELCSMRNIVDIVVSMENVCYWNSGHISESLDRHDAVYNDFLVPLLRKAIKIVAEIPDTNAAQSLIEKFPECTAVPYWGINRYSYLKKGTSKMNAIKAVAQILGMDPAEIAAFGDDYNDIEMIEQCGIGIAVANAIEPVLLSAKHITKSNDEDGVAAFIKANFLR